MSLAFIFSHVLILSLRSLVPLAQRLVHQRDAYFLNLRATSFTSLSSSTSLYSKICSTICSHSKNSSGSSFPFHSGMSTLKVIRVGGRTPFSSCPPLVWPHLQIQSIGFQPHSIHQELIRRGFPRLVALTS